MFPLSIPRAESGCRLKMDHLRLHPFRDLDARSSLSLSSLSSDVACDDCCSLREADKFFLPLVRRRLKVKDVESCTREMPFLQEFEHRGSFDNISSRSVDKANCIPHPSQSC